MIPEVQLLGEDSIGRPRVKETYPMGEMNLTGDYRREKLYAVSRLMAIGYSAIAQKQNWICYLSKGGVSLEYAERMSLHELDTRFHGLLDVVKAYLKATNPKPPEH